MSIVRINDGLDIQITDDQELEEAMALFIDYLNSGDTDDTENEKKLDALQNAMNVYDGNYHTIDLS